MDTMKTEAQDPELDVVDFDSAEDPSNPLDWPRKFKWFLVVLVSLMTTVVTLATLFCTPAVPQILRDFHSTNSYESVLLVSIFELGAVFGPFVIAPSSELYGRLPVWHTANICFVVFLIISASSRNIHMLIAFRFLTGVASLLVLGPAIMSDLFPVEERGTAISVNSLMPLIGPSLGPTFGSFTSQALGWRWMFWLVAIMTAFVEVLLLLFMRETYAVTILEKKTRKLKKVTGNRALKSKYDRGISGKAIFLRAFIRPTKIIMVSPVVAMLSLYLAFVYGYLYIVLTTMTEILEHTYKWSQDRLGMSAGAIIRRFFLDAYLIRQATKGKKQPENRLHLMVLGGFTVPAGRFLYGWTADKGVQWMVPIIGTAFIGFGLTITSTPTQTYLADIFPLHAASANAAGYIFRSVAGAVFPLIGPPLYDALGIGWGNSLLGFVALASTPVPILFCLYGKSLRKRFPVDV